MTSSSTIALRARDRDVPRRSTRRDGEKWTAWWLSLVAPGAGQLLARSLWCVPWLVAAGLTAAFGAWVASAVGGTGLAPFAWALQVASLLTLGACSAEHARRLYDPAVSRESALPACRVNCVSHRGRSIDIRIELNLQQRADFLWRRVADLTHFLTIDPFHEFVSLGGQAPAAGVELALAHNAAGLRFMRFGRIVRWSEGRGYEFSDLSARGRQRGFPHVFYVQVDPLDEEHREFKRNDRRTCGDSLARSRLTVRVCGKWTSQWIPVWVGRLWIRWVCREHARLLCKGLAA